MTRTRCSSGAARGARAKCSSSATAASCAGASPVGHAAVQDVLTPPRAEVGPLELENPRRWIPCRIVRVFTAICYRSRRSFRERIVLGGGPQLTGIENLPARFVALLPGDGFGSLCILASPSRSTTLSALEASLEDYFSSMLSLPLAFKKTGKPSMGRLALVKNLCELLRFGKTTRRISLKRWTSSLC